MKLTEALLVVTLTAGLSSEVTAAKHPLFAGNEAVPADATVLFDGTDLSAWVSVENGSAAPWKLENGYMEVRGGNIRTRQEFGDFQLHVEFWLPKLTEPGGRANSGVYLQGIYEVQVLDSYDVETPQNWDCGGIYSVAAPLVNACRPPEHWQSFDIVFRAAKLAEDGSLVSPARITVLHNGVLVQENTEVRQATAAGISEQISEKGPIMLQDHGNPVRFRNIWIRPL